MCRNVRYYISGSECPGEGEVKLMDWINTHVLRHDEGAEPGPPAGGKKGGKGSKGGSKGQPQEVGGLTRRASRSRAAGRRVLAWSLVADPRSSTIEQSLVVVGGDADLVLQVSPKGVGSARAATGWACGAKDESFTHLPSIAASLRLSPGIPNQGLALPGLPDFNVYIPDVKRSGYFVSLR